MKPQVNATISFGVRGWEVTVPVGVAGAVTEKNDPSFRVLHATCTQPVTMKTVANEAKKNGTAEGAAHVTADPIAGAHALALSWCDICNEEAHETVRGFEFSKGQYVVFTDQEVEEAKGNRSPAIQLTKFVKRTEVPSTLIAKHYFLIPNQRAGEGYGLLYQALAKTKTDGIGSQRLWGKETPCAIRADQSFERRGVLMLMVLHCWEDMVEPDFEAPIPNKEAKKLTEEFVANSTSTLEPSDLVSRARVRMNDLIEAKMAGIELPARETLTEPDVTVDIMERLKKSVELSAKK